MKVNNGDNSRSFGSRKDTYNNVCGKSSHSNEPQIKNLESQNYQYHRFSQIASQNPKSSIATTSRNQKAFPKGVNLQDNSQRSLVESQGSNNDCCNCYKRLEIEFRKQHSLENTIEEYMVVNRKLHNILKQEKQKFFDLQKKHSGCSKKNSKLKEIVHKLESDKKQICEKWVKLSSKNKIDTIAKEKYT